MTVIYASICFCGQMYLLLIVLLLTLKMQQLMENKFVKFPSFYKINPSFLAQFLNCINFLCSSDLNEINKLILINGIEILNLAKIIKWKKSMKHWQGDDVGWAFEYFQIGFICGEDLFQWNKQILFMLIWDIQSLTTNPLCKHEAKKSSLFLWLEKLEFFSVNLANKISVQFAIN